jgi:hypothetical protein
MKMNELSASIATAAEGTAIDLDDAGVKWAEFALRNMRAPLLGKALAISQAIAEFMAEYNPPSDESRDDR